MDAEWLTYREAAKRLGSNIEAVRQRAIRCRCRRAVAAALRRAPSKTTGFLFRHDDAFNRRCTRSTVSECHLPTLTAHAHYEPRSETEELFSFLGWAASPS
jgi:hypothetical protein